jgi:predicted GIY-YIG superfamily endonuclease
MEENVEKKEYVCYLLISECLDRTYIGITNNLEKRIKQHNGQISGGAKYTCSGRPWKIYGFVNGFCMDKSSVLKFEWRWKFLSKKERGSPLEKRLKSLNKLIENPSYYIENFILNLKWNQ